MLLSDAIGRILEGVKDTPEKQELELLLNNIQHYLRKVLQSTSPGVRTEIHGHYQFNSKEEPISARLALELERRVNLLANIQLPSAKRATEHLLTSLHPPVEFLFTPRQVALIQALNQDPRLGIVALAKKLQTSSRKINHERQSLFHTYGIHISGCIDPHRFKLAEFGVYFRTHSIKASQDFEAWIRNDNQGLRLFPFFLGLCLDLSHREGYFALLVPQQQRSLRNFRRTLQYLRETYCEAIESYKIFGCSVNVSFDCYDYVSSRWSVSADLRTEGILKFLEQHQTSLMTPPGIHYATEAIRFTPSEWILAILNLHGTLTKHEQRSILTTFGYPMAAKTLWSQKAKLYRINAIYPHIEFSPLAFEDIICLFIKCSTDTSIAIHQLASQFAYSRFHSTDQGAIILIGTPVGSASLLKHLTQALIHHPGITDFKGIRLQYKLPLIPSLQTHHLWNTRSQMWQNQELQDQ